jgi:glycosyltransferase involved in cell wall biosynthesis
MLHLFYEEPDPDRWLPFDRYPRRVIRRLARGKPRAGGQQRVFLNLCAGLDKLGIKYRINDYGYAQKHPNELVCIIGKPHLLDKIPWRNPICFGAAVYSHPMDDPTLLTRLPIKKVLVPGEWMRRMCGPYWRDKVVAWPVGIDTEKWRPRDVDEKRKAETLKTEIRTTDFLIYDKVRWEHDRFEGELIQPIRDELKRRNLDFREIRYGFYEEEDFCRLLQECRAMIFLCEHETQGIAYQQALSSGVPLLAWDRGGFWRDPEYYPHRVKFQPVSSVPYWDERCGVKFENIQQFQRRLDVFQAKLQAGSLKPRDYILENLTLEECARQYLGIIAAVQTELQLE